MMTSGEMPSKYSATIFTQPWGDSIFIQSPSSMPYCWAVAGLIFTQGRRLRSRR